MKIKYLILTFIFTFFTLYAQGEKNNNSYQIAEHYYLLGESCYYANHLDSALYYYKQAFEIQEQIKENDVKDKKNIDNLKTKLLICTGVVNYVQGNYDLALDNYFKALDIAEENQNTDNVLDIYYTLANTYNKMSNYSQAEDYYLKGEKLSREINDSTNLAVAYQGLCSISINKEDYTQAIKYAGESYRILSALPDIPADQLMSATQELTEAWLKIPDYGKVMEYAQKTIEYAKQTGVSSYLAAALYTLSFTYLQQKKYEESEKTALEALATDTTDVYINSVLYGNIAKANAWMGNPAKSVAYFEKTTNAIRAFSNKNFQSSLSEMEVKYETEKKELKITILEKEKRLMTGLNIAGGAVLLLTLAVFFFLWRWMIQKRKLAESKIKQLEQEKQLIATQAVLDGETRERARLARDLHDGLGSMLTGAKLNLLEMKKDVRLEFADVEHFNDAMEMLDDSIREMRRVAHHLMPDSLSRFGLNPAVSDFCSNLPFVSFVYYGDESRLDPKLEVMIYRSIHELVNNALKHAGASKIMVQIIQEPDRIAFTVQDDGCGFDPSAETEGMGLQNIRNRVASYNGMIDIHSMAGEGTEVNVELNTPHPLKGEKSPL